MLKQWFKDESGQAMSEYGLLIAMIVVALIVTLAVFRDNLKDAFTKAGNSLKNQSEQVDKK